MIACCAAPGCYADDVNLPGQVYACMVRSPHAHARIKSISKIPGVIAVLTGKDAVADGLQPIPTRPVTVNPHEVKLQNRDGSPFHIPPYPALPVDEVRFVGQAVAVVIACDADGGEGWRRRGRGRLRGFAFHHQRPCGRGRGQRG